MQICSRMNNQTWLIGQCLLAVLFFHAPLYSVSSDGIRLVPNNQEVITDDAWKQLEMSAVVKAIDTTHTALGSTKLAALTRPINCCETIKKRQEVIIALASGSVLADADALFHDIKLHESSIESYGTLVGNRLFNKACAFYYTWLLKKANNSSYALAFGYWAKLLGTTGFTALLTSGNYLLQNITDSVFSPTSNKTLGSFLKKTFWPGDILQGFSSKTELLASNDQINACAQDQALCRSIFASSDATVGDRVNAFLASSARSCDVVVPESNDTNIIDSFKKAHPYTYWNAKLFASAEAYATPLMRLGTVALIAGGMGFSAYDIISSEQELWEHVRKVSAWAMAVDALVRYLRRLSVEWEQRDELERLLRDPMVKQFFDGALTFYDSWGYRHRWLHNPGSVLQIHRLAQKVALKLTELRHVIGEIDAYMSVARARNSLGLCKVEFIDSERACFSAWGLRSLVIPYAKMVSNNVDLGIAKPNKMAVTGPNGGGKSTVMKSVGQGAVLGLSCGFVPAERVRMNCFKCIIVALDPQQSMQAELSTFMHELVQLKRTLKLIDVCKAYSDNCLVLIDEPCRGTIEEVAAERVSDLCIALRYYANAAVILATHLYKPALLTDDMPTWQSCQMGYSFEGDVVRRTYELLPGIAHWWFTDDNARRRFLNYLEAGLTA